MTCGYDVVLSVSGRRGDVNRFVKAAAGPDEIVWRRTQAECVLQMIEVWQADKSVPFAVVYERMHDKFGMPPSGHASILSSVDDASVQAAIEKIRADHAAELERMKAVPRKRTKLSLAKLCPPTAEHLDMPWLIGRRRWLWGFGVDIADPHGISLNTVARGHAKTARYEFVGHGDPHYQWFAGELATLFPELDFTMTCQSPRTDDDHWLAATVAAKGEWYMIKRWYPRESGCPGKWSQREELAGFLSGKAARLLRSLKTELASMAPPDRAPDPA